LGDGPMPPGTEGRVQLVLERPIAAAVGDRFVLRDTSAQRTIGGGDLLDLRPPARRRRTPERRALLDAQAIADPQSALALLSACPPHLVVLVAFSRARALAQSEIATVSTNLQVVALTAGGTTLALSRDTATDIKRRIAAALAVFHRERPDAVGIDV